MNKVILMGRLTRDPDIRYTAGNNPMAIARYTLAVDRRYRDGNSEQTADFISCVAFARQAEFAERYLHQGTKLVVEGRIQTGSYTNKDGQKVYTTEVVVENCEFAESKASGSSVGETSGSSTPDAYVGEDGFMNIPDGVEEGLPFN
ncbi:MAG: single-stranded DNA-binding protein [Lachnospiraceae bacterium]|nr:single-stranded DNA-binding protein [Lachnospiraceae bacterium]